MSTRDALLNDLVGLHAGYVPASAFHFARGRVQGSRDDAEQCRLARSVWAYHPVDAAARDFKIDVFQGCEASEVAAQVFDPQDGSHLRPPSVAATKCRVAAMRYMIPIKPPGSTRTIRMRRAP